VDLVVKLQGMIEENITGRAAQEEPPTISPSAAARGCVLAVAYELLGMPKPEPDPRSLRAMQVGTDGHRRIVRYFGHYVVGRELFFYDREYGIRGYCDALLYLPPDFAGDRAGLYALEVKTTGGLEFERIRAGGAPRDDHARQCQIYIWGVSRYYPLFQVRGGIIFYENRDSLEHLIYVVDPDPTIVDYLDRLRAARERVLARGELPLDDRLPDDHWAHLYCPFLDICPPGQEALRRQRAHGPRVPDQVVAEMLARRLVARRQAERRQGRPAGPRSLDDLAAALGWFPEDEG